MKTSNVRLGACAGAVLLLCGLVPGVSAAAATDPVVYPVVKSAAENLGSRIVDGFAANDGKTYTGAGYSVVDIDGSFRTDNGQLAGKVVAEGCFGATPASDQTKNLCSPAARISTDGLSVSELGPGASGPNQNCTNPSDGSLCQDWHGTGTSTLAVGRKVTANNNTYAGVATGANLIALKVGSKTGWPEPAINAALSYVYDLAKSGAYKIAAVNLSDSGTARVNDSEACTSTVVNAWAGKLRSDFNIPVVVAAGNSKFASATGSYACGSNVIAVGSTKASNLNLLTDGSEGTNASSRTALLAPVGDAEVSTGDMVWCGYMGSGYVAGTSFASPQVAGAFAVLRERFPTATVDQLVAQMRNTGTAVTDTRPGSTGIATPRLNLQAALNARTGRPTTDVNGDAKSDFLAFNTAGELDRWGTDGAGNFVSSDITPLATDWSAHALTTPVYDLVGSSTNGMIASVGTDFYYYGYNPTTKKLDTRIAIGNGLANGIRAITYARNLTGPGTGGSVIAQTTSGSIVAFTQQPDRTTLAAAKPVATPAAGDQLIAVTDLNGDGKLDLVTRDATSKKPVAYFGTGAGAFSSTRTVLATAPYWQNMEQLVVLDQFADGKPYIGYRALPGGNLVIFPLNSNGTVDEASARGLWGFTDTSWTFAAAPQR